MKNNQLSLDAINILKGIAYSQLMVPPSLFSLKTNAQPSSMLVTSTPHLSIPKWTPSPITKSIPQS